MTRYEVQLHTNLNTPKKYIFSKREYFLKCSEGDKQIKNIFDVGFIDMGSYYSLGKHLRFLFCKDDKFLYLSKDGNSLFNVEFKSIEVAIATLLNLKKINDLKYELNIDQISIDFYLDSTALKEILENYKN